MSSPLKQNTTTIQELLNIINELPNAGGVELPELTNPVSSEKVVHGYEYINQDGEQEVGTMTDNGAVNGSVDEASDYAIPEGYHNGQGKAALSASVKENITAAFTAVSNKGGTVPSSKVSGNLASAIASIPEGVTVQIKTGTVTGVSGSAKTVNVGFKPDAVFFTGTAPQVNNQAVHSGVAFTEKNVTSMRTFYSTSSTSYILCILTVGQVSNGFTVSGIRINTSGQQSNESNRNIPYIAIKYTK